ncbi:hypothetical protein GpartN1_g3784.t1 [Galdieria partita]|uniref:AD domain-containing protein n=1 Tax=Galdieria partita TaxID=83374 RepID=A0A9C7UQJ8_9RHOD|nr:hypothetical protein GpartN1_g3784.t1 [Galdieria partita]
MSSWKSKGNPWDGLDNVGYPIHIFCRQEIQVQGYLYTEDPDTHNLLLLSHYDPTVGKFTQLTLVMGSAIQSITRIEITEEELQLSYRVKQANQLEQVFEFSDESKVNTLDSQVSKDTKERCNKLLELLDKHQWKAEWSPTTGVVQVMEGLVRIEPPYTKESCFSTQQNVLLQIYPLLENL